jgi:Phage terminase large subunit
MVSFSAGQEAARRLLEGPQRYTCLAGGTRSGKTFLIVRMIMIRALQAKGSRHAILRHHANAARASIALGTLPQVVQLCFPGVRLKEHRQDGYFALPNGSRVWIGGLDDNDRVEKILGLEYASVFLNEASQIPYSTALVAFTRLAQVTRGIHQHAFVDLNPAGKSHWTNVLFGEQRDPVSMQPIKERNKRSYRSFPEWLCADAGRSVSIFRWGDAGVEIRHARKVLDTGRFLGRCRVRSTQLRSIFPVAIIPRGLAASRVRHHYRRARRRHNLARTLGLLSRPLSQSMRRDG